MKHFFDFDSVKCTAVAFGFFDAMHAGHRRIIEKLSEYENSAVISFYNYDKSFVYTETEKEIILSEYGIASMISVNAREYESLNLQGFVHDCIAGKLGVKTIIVGENSKDIEIIEKACIADGIELVKVPVVKDGENIVSTDLVVSAMHNDMNMALKLINCNYVVHGNVIHGKGQGSRHDMPTANIAFDKNRILPVYGVYGAKVTIDGNVYRGITNIGTRPTVDDDPAPTCETLVLDFDGNLYNKQITLELYVYIRQIVKFSSFEELKKQIEKDISSLV